MGKSSQDHNTPILLTQEAIFLMIGKWSLPDMCPG